MLLIRRLARACFQALDYAKVQIKYRPVHGSKDSLNEPDSSRGFEHDYSPPMDDGHKESHRMSIDQ
jgi:hypothetical protein